MFYVKLRLKYIHFIPLNIILNNFFNSLNTQNINQLVKLLQFFFFFLNFLKDNYKSESDLVWQIHFDSNYLLQFISMLGDNIEIS